MNTVVMAMGPNMELYGPTACALICWSRQKEQRATGTSVSPVGVCCGRRWG